MPIRSQCRPDLAPPPAAHCASVQSCRRSATSTVLDHKSPGVKEVRMIGPASRCLALRSCHTRPVNCRLSGINCVSLENITVDNDGTVLIRQEEPVPPLLLLRFVSIGLDWKEMDERRIFLLDHINLLFLKLTYWMLLIVLFCLFLF